MTTLKHPGGRPPKPSDDLRHHKDALAIVLSAFARLGLIKDKNGKPLPDTIVAALAGRVIEGQFEEFAAGVHLDALGRRSAQVKSTDGYTYKRLRGRNSSGTSANDWRRIGQCADVLFDVLLAETAHIAFGVAQVLEAGAPYVRARSDGKPGKLAWSTPLRVRLLAFAEMLNANKTNYWDADETKDLIRDGTNRPSVVFRNQR